MNLLENSRTPRAAGQSTTGTPYLGERRPSGEVTIVNGSERSSGALEAVQGIFVLLALAATPLFDSNRCRRVADLRVGGGVWLL